MSRSPHPRPPNTHCRGRSVAARPQPPPRQSRLALHNRKCPRQTQAPVPFTLSESGHWCLLQVRSPETAMPTTAAFRQGLRDAGFIEGQNVEIEYRFASARFDLLPALAAELVSLRVNAIAAGYSAVKAVRA